MLGQIGAAGMAKIAWEPAQRQDMVVVAVFGRPPCTVEKPLRMTMRSASVPVPVAHSQG